MKTPPTTPRRTEENMSIYDFTATNLDARCFSW